MGNKPFPPVINLLIIATTFLDGPVAASNSPIITVNECSVWSLDYEANGHFGTSLNILDAWNDKMVLFKYPSTCIPHYKLTYSASITITGVTAQYDGGATIILQDSNRNELGSSACYLTNGYNKNTCTVTVTEPKIDTIFHVLVDSSNSRWNWMGEFKVQPDALPTTPSPTLLVTSSPTSVPSSTPTLHSTTNPSPALSAPPTTIVDTLKSFSILLEETTFDTSSFQLTNIYETSDITSRNQANITIMDFNCNSTYGGSDPVSSVTDTVHVVSVRTTHLVGNSLSTTFDIDKFALGNSTLTLPYGDLEKSVAGELQFCVKVQIMMGDISVKFRESNIVLGYNLSSNSFSITGNDIEKEAIVTSTEDAINIYSLIACRCGTTGYDCLGNLERNQALNQDSIIHICLHPNSTDVTISKFNMIFQDDISKVNFITVTESTGIQGFSAVSGMGTFSTPFKVTSRLITDIFDNGATDFEVRGDALLKFESSNRNLNLRKTNRILQQGEINGEPASYEMKVKIASRGTGYSTTTFSTTIVMGGFVLFLIVFVIYKKMH